MVRVTACHALAELIEKACFLRAEFFFLEVNLYDLQMDPKAMKSFTTAILSCLINCFKDRNWMVKDGN